MHPVRSGSDLRMRPLPLLRAPGDFPEGKLRDLHRDQCDAHRSSAANAAARYFWSYTRRSYASLLRVRRLGGQRVSRIECALEIADAKALPIECRVPVEGGGAAPRGRARPGRRSQREPCAQSSTDRQIGPILSIVQLSAIAPVRGTRPKLGRNPVVPQRVDGDAIDPSVSVPMANPTHPAAVALAAPAEEPLDPCRGFQGLRVRTPGLPPQRSPCASAPSVSLATSTAPAASSRFDHFSILV